MRARVHARADTTILLSLLLLPIAIVNGIRRLPVTRPGDRVFRINGRPGHRPGPPGRVRCARYTPLGSQRVRTFSRKFSICSNRLRPGIRRYTYAITRTIHGQTLKKRVHILRTTTSVRNLNLLSLRRSRWRVKINEPKSIRAVFTPRRGQYPPIFVKRQPNNTLFPGTVEQVQTYPKNNTYPRP